MCRDSLELFIKTHARCLFKVISVLSFYVCCVETRLSCLRCRLETHARCLFKVISVLSFSVCCLEEGNDQMHCLSLSVYMLHLGSSFIYSLRPLFTFILHLFDFDGDWSAMSLQPFPCFMLSLCFSFSLFLACILTATSLFPLFMGTASLFPLLCIHGLCFLVSLDLYPWTLLSCFPCSVSNVASYLSPESCPRFHVLAYYVMTTFILLQGLR